MLADVYAYLSIPKGTESMKITKEQLKKLILEEFPTTKRGPGIRIAVSFDLVPGPDDQIDLGGFRAKLRALMAGLSARAVSSTHEIEVKPSNASIEITRIS